MIEHELPTFLRDAVEHELESGERIEWMGRPKLFFTMPSTLMVLFLCVLWTPIALFFTAIGIILTVMGAWMTRETNGVLGPVIVFLFSLLFTLFGLAMLSVPFLVYRHFANIVYVITNRRAITVEGVPKITIRSYPPNELRNMYRREKRDGFGDIIIAGQKRSDAHGSHTSEKLLFWNVRDVKRIEELLRLLAKQSDAAGSK